MRLSIRVGLAGLGVAAVLGVTQVSAQSQNSVSGQLRGLTTTMMEISNKLDGLAEVLALSVARADPVNFVEVALDLGSGDCVNVGKKFDHVLLPDGTGSDLQIPAGHVLIVTEIEILGFGADPTDNVQTRIFRGIDFNVNLVARRESTASADGRIFHFYAFKPGVIVANGGEICTNNNLGITTSGHLRGYFARQ